MKQKKIFLAADHAGFELKEYIKDYLQRAGFVVEDCGAHKFDEQDDYPDIIFQAAVKVAKDRNSKGIIFGGSGQGEAIVANRIKGIRAAVYYGDNLEIVNLSRTHNDANILSLGAKFVEKEEAVKAIDSWLSVDFSNEERHVRRIKKIDNMK